MSASLQRFSEQFEKLSPREQRLAGIVGTLVLIFLVFMVVRMALDTLDTLDSRINRLQATILNTTNQIRHRESIEAQYARVASQHSSAWSAAEIHDRLRAEIYRLAQKQPPQLNAEGVPEKVTNTLGDLVSIPTLQQGNLSEGAQGYREYTLSFSLTPAPLQNVLDFIDRLQNSPQSLRVDVLELTRDPLDSNVAANLTITRTIVAGVVEDPAAKKAAPKPAAVATVDAAPSEPGMRLNAAEWKCQDCEVRAEPEKGEAMALVITPKAAGAQAYLERTMPPGVYEVSLDIQAAGPAALAVAEAGKELKGATELPAGQATSCTFQFNTASAERGQLRFPLLTMNETGSELRVTRVAMKKVEK